MHNLIYHTVGFHMVRPCLQWLLKDLRVPWWQPQHCSGLANLPFKGALVTPIYNVDLETRGFCVFCILLCLLIGYHICLLCVIGFLFLNASSSDFMDKFVSEMTYTIECRVRQKTLLTHPFLQDILVLGYASCSYRRWGLIYGPIW